MLALGGRPSQQNFHPTLSLVLNFYAFADLKGLTPSNPILPRRTNYKLHLYCSGTLSLPRFVSLISISSGSSICVVKWHTLNVQTLGKMGSDNYIHRDYNSIETLPLQRVEELLSWSETNNLSLQNAILPLPPCHQGLPKRPRLIACHDLAGGYHEEERCFGGSSNPSFYSLERWAAVDIFVYFSHHLVSIPPLSYINAAHRHNVKVLGTLLTEWEAGTIACQQLFQDKETALHTAAQLAAIAKCHGFEGWIINIENDVPMHLIPNILVFLENLSRDDGLVLWYDAVTVLGSLEWQNSLNSKNRPFFDSCHGIWLNYCWKTGDPEKLADLYGCSRRFDVYFGVDCFGRGSPGGGGFHCDQALREVYKFGYSTALFAIAWPYEEKEHSTDFPSSWRQKDAVFWNRIEAAWPGRHAVVTELPFLTTFCAGYGYTGMYERGVIIKSSTPWHCLNLQSIQPEILFNESSLQLVADGQLRVQTTQECAFSGSTCLKVSSCAMKRSTINFDIFPYLNIPVSNTLTLEVAVCVEKMGTLKDIKIILKAEEAHGAVAEMSCLPGEGNDMAVEAWHVSTSTFHIVQKDVIKSIQIEVVSHAGSNELVFYVGKVKLV